MRAKVLKTFRHVNTGRLWRSGETFEGDAGAASELASRGYLEAPAVAAAGPADEPDYDGMTVRQLVELCARRGVETPRKPRKADLVAALKAAG